MKVYFGTDPEFVILNKAGKPCPAHLWFPGKDDKLQVPIKERGYGKLFRDGFALEINVPPAYCRSVLSDSMKVMLKAAQKKLPVGYTLATMPAVRINLSSLRKAPYDVAQFGCDPSLNAYTGEEGSIDLDGMKHPYRYTGGHLHFSANPMPTWAKKFENVCLFIRMMDLHVGVPLAMIFNDKGNVLRRRYYGKAGEFRLQSYADKSAGIEWRVPSSQIWNNEAVTMMALGIGRELFVNFEKYVGSYKKYLASNEAEVRSIINEGSKPSFTSMFTGYYAPATLKVAVTEKAFHVFKLGKPVPKNHLCNFPGWAGWRQKKGV